MSKNVSPRRWSIEKRLEFIDFHLYWNGQINRADIREKFGVSVPQASADLSKYGEEAPGNLSYDLSQKKYFASPNFKPVFFSPDAEGYLWQLRDDVRVIAGLDSSEIQSLPFHDIVPLPKRNIDPQILRIVVSAVRDKDALEIYYQSMSSDKPKWRVISPHAFAFDGHRWHVRAFCHKEKYFKDFLLARVRETKPCEDRYISGKEDNIWNEIFTIILKPHPKLSESQSKAVAADYNMTEMKLEIKMRLALLYYFLRRMELQDCDGSLSEPHEQHIVVCNKEETLKAKKRLNEAYLSSK